VSFAARSSTTIAPFSTRTSSTFTMPGELSAEMHEFAGK
jgi:hypothetical protein